jgi:putative transposase
MVSFIDQHRDTYGVEPICAVLPIAPSTYFLREAQQQDATKRSARARRDDELRAAIQRVWDENEQVYGPRKVWRQLRPEGVRVARCTIERLMRDMRIKGVTRGRAWIVTTGQTPPPTGRAISSIASSRRCDQISSGSQTSPMWPRGAASSMWPL